MIRSETYYMKNCISETLKFTCPLNAVTLIGKMAVSDVADISILRKLLGIRSP